MARSAGSGLVAGSVASGLVAVKDPPPVRWRASAKEALPLARSVASGLVARSGECEGGAAAGGLAGPGTDVAGECDAAGVGSATLVLAATDARGSGCAGGSLTSAAGACPTRTCVPRNLVLVTLLNRANAG